MSERLYFQRIWLKRSDIFLIMSCKCVEKLMQKRRKPKSQSYDVFFKPQLIQYARLSHPKYLSSVTLATNIKPLSWCYLLSLLANSLLACLEMVKFTSIDNLIMLIWFTLNFDSIIHHWYLALICLLPYLPIHTINCLFARCEISRRELFTFLIIHVEFPFASKLLSR